MKKLLTLTVLGLALNLTSQAQSLTMNNNTGCALNVTVQIAENTNLCGLPVYTWGSIISNGTTTLLISNSMIGPMPPIVPATFIRLTAGGVWVPPMRPPVCPSCSVVQTSVCSGAPQTNVMYQSPPCIGMYNMTWTDLGGGSAQVDIN